MKIWSFSFNLIDSIVRPIFIERNQEQNIGLTLVFHIAFQILGQVDVFKNVVDFQIGQLLACKY